MIPEPSKRSFGFPIPAAALEFFCHPVMEPFTRPVRHGDLVLAANGYVGIRVRRFHGMAEDYAEASPAFLERWNTLPWSKLDAPNPKDEWRMMDDSRGSIYRGEVERLWHPGPKNNFAQSYFTYQTLVCTAGGPLVPLALLQLLARLPRAEVRMCTRYWSDPLLIRFSGGEAIVPPRWPDMSKAKVSAAFHLFKPKSGSPLPGGLL